MSNLDTLQNIYLQELIDQKLQVAIYLVNGIKLLGEVVSFDQYVILLKHDSNQMVHKHAIATIMPVSADSAGRA